MKILLFGCNGQVGWELQRSLAPLGEVFALQRNAALNPQGLAGDLSAPDALADTIRRLAPGVIVNAAAHTAVDRAESEPELARTLNATAPGLIAREAAALGAWLVHYSTDYVFSGQGSAAHREDDVTAPINTYGQTKLEGEQLIRASGCKHLVFRTSWVYGARGGNFAKTMLRLAVERESLNVIDDQIGAPTGADLLADLTAHALQRVQQRPDNSGTYHCAAAGQTSWHGYASHVFQWARAHGQTLKISPEGLHAIPTSAYPTPAQRPLNSRLDTTKLRQAWGLHMPPWQQGVNRMLTEIFL